MGQIGMTYAEKVCSPSDLLSALRNLSNISQYVGFWLAYTLPTIVFCLCPIILWIGRNRYEQAPPSGSVLASALRIFVFAAKGKWSLNPIRTWKNMSAPGFWDAAKPSMQVNQAKPGWMVYDDLWVDEVKRGFKACAVFLWFPLYCEWAFLALFSTKGNESVGKQGLHTTS